MSTAQAIRAELELSGASIRTAVHSCEFADRVIALLMAQSERMTNSMARVAIELIAFRVIAKGLGKLSAAGKAALNDIERIQAEITDMHRTLLDAANDNRRMAAKTEQMLPKLAEAHRRLEEALTRLYKSPVAEDFGIAGETRPKTTPVRERHPLRPTETDWQVEVSAGGKTGGVSRLVRKGLKLVEDLKTVAGKVSEFSLGPGGKSGRLVVDGKTYKVRQVHIFNSAEGEVFMFDLVDPTALRGTRRAVHTRTRSGSSKTFFEFAMLEEGYGKKPVFAHVIHAHHPVSDVLMNAFKVFGETENLGYAYEKWWTMLLSNGRLGTPHQTVTARQGARRALTDDWVKGASETYRAAMKFKKQFGRPNSMKLTEFPVDVSKFSFRPLLKDAEADLAAAGVPEAERRACMDAFKKQARERIAPLLEKNLHPEHAKAIMEGL